MNDTEFKTKPVIVIDLKDIYTKGSATGGKFKEFLKLKPGIEELLWEYRNKNYLILGVTNNQTVPFNLESEGEAGEYYQKILKEFVQNPFNIVRVSFNDEKGNRPPHNFRSLMTKPSTGMLSSIESECYEEHSIIIDWNNSIVTGSNVEDEEFANNAKIKYLEIKNFLK